ncbi:MAG: DUF4007 family protein [Clostridia bacterium]|nr:DUF4007 family protein [Clostridia bacterium]
MLPVNFHKTFIPERRYIAALLDYAALGKRGNYREISAVTGIPMGKSSGKVPAIIDYARGMGLIKQLGENGRRTKQPALTSFGRIVYTEDKFLGEKMVQWLVHMNLCRSDIGAKAWHAVFAKGRIILGTAFTKGQLEDYLVSIFGAGKERTGPMVVAYAEDAALARANVMSVTGDSLVRNKAPVLDVYATTYSAYILHLMEIFFPGQDQVALSDFNRDTLWFDTCLWNQSDVERVLAIVDQKGFISIDRQMQPWIVERKGLAEDVWPHIFDDLP